MSTNHHPVPLVSRSSMMRSGILFFLVVATSCPVIAQDRGRDRWRDGRRDWNPTEYLKEIDRDKNGYVDTRELQGRMKDYIAKQGFDVSKPVSVAKIIAKYNAGVEAKANAEKKAALDASRRVPKFGTGETVTPAPDFGSRAASAQAQQGRLEDLYEEDIVKMVQSYMNRLDENKDGWLDEKEASRISRMLGDDADTDGNRKLGELELAAALKKRRDAEPKKVVKGSGAARVFSSSRGGSAVPSNPTPLKSSSTTSSRSLVGRQSSYVDGIFRKYDKDGSGTLSKSERKEMSSSVSSRFVDSDGDGEISRSEATDSLLGTAKAAPVSTSSSAKSNKSRGDGSRSSRPSSGRSAGSDVTYDVKGFQRVPIPSQTRTDAETDLNRKGASSAFLDLDVNRDGQITMAEFRKGAKWTDELAEEFYDLDLNGDGVVTIAEFNEK